MDLGNLVEVVVLGVVQGVAEFLPISSSGHLVIGKSLLGLGEAGIRLDIFLHVGTLAAVFAYYWRVVRRMVVGREWSYLFKIALSAVPCAVVGLCFKDSLESAFSSVRAVGMALLFTGAVLSATRFLPRGDRPVSWVGAVIMGLAQAVAVLPGVSRSGMTLAAARGARIDAGKSAEFSFLMSAPPIAGAALLEALKSASASGGAAAGNEVSWALCLLGAAIAAVVGYVSLKVLVSLLKSDRFWLFGPYCLLAGILAVCL